MAEIAEAVVEMLATMVSEAIPVVAARIPPGPAAQLGRIGAPSDGAVGPVAGIRGGLAGGEARGVRPRPVRAGGAGVPAESPVVRALREVGPLLAERLLGALELTVAALDAAGLPDLSSSLALPLTGRVTFASAGQDSQVVTAVTLLERLRPGAADLAAALTRQLAAHPLVVPLLAVPPGAADEASVAAAHGAAHVALSVVVANAALGSWRPPPALVDSPAAAVIGVAAGAAVLLLRDIPMPAGYAAALLEKARAEYLLPRRVSGSVPVTGHRFALAEGEVPEAADFSGNGLVAVAPAGVVIRTGAAAGRVRVQVRIEEQSPPLDARAWDEVVEVSWRAAAGLASVTGPEAPGDHRLRRVTPPWPGDYRLRVHARGRDDADEDEGYELVIWAAPAAPDIVHKRTDLTGYRLRGEPEPSRPQPPERAYRWVRRSALDIAATVTVVTGSTTEEVVRAFGADPRRPESLRAIADDLNVRMSVDPWVAVLEAGAAVLAIEYNGFQGSNGGVLGRASAGGRAASMFWNVNAMTSLSFAEDGQVLASFEWPEDVDAVPAVAAALDGLDFHDHRNKTAKGLVAVERFTGRGITAQDLAQIEAADIAFRITPQS
ncbi:MAG: DUF6461 domain-containing protein [Trebonia sp.]